MRLDLCQCNFIISRHVSFSYAQFGKWNTSAFFQTKALQCRKLCATCSHYSMLALQLKRILHQLFHHQNCKTPSIDAETGGALFKLWCECLLHWELIFLGVHHHCHHHHHNTVLHISLESGNWSAAKGNQALTHCTVYISIWNICILRIAAWYLRYCNGELRSPRHWELEDLGFEHYEAPEREHTSYLVVCCVTYGRILQVVLHIITIYRMRVICQVSWLAINSIRQSVQMLAFSFFFQVSNYARRHADSAMRSQHNQIYWHGKPYAAYGNGAASFVNAVRASRNLVTLY